MNPPLPERPARERLQPHEPTVVQIDPECLRVALKEFFEPLRTNDPRTDFFAVYRKESADFDRDYARKYDEDLNTSLIFAGLFSAVSSAFIIDVQSELQQDPNQMTAAYMQVLIHAMNNSLFPDADPNSATWTGPPPEIISVQALLYASLATSLLAAFLAMLGKQWVNRYLRNRGGSTADKSRDRQRKLDGLESWHFYLAIEGLPVMLQLALLLLGCALSRYLWGINLTVAGVVVAVTLFGFTSYAFLTLAATLYYNCPYQTPPSIIIRSLIRYLIRSDSAFARSLRSLISPLPSIKKIGRVLRQLRSGVYHVLGFFRFGPNVVQGAGNIPLAAIVASPARIFQDVPVNWDVCRADLRCISWILYSTTEVDVIFSTVRFAADMIWYPEIAKALSPHILAELFFDCLLDGRVILGKSEHASSIGMALASVLSIHLSIEPGDEDLKDLCGRIHNHVKWVSSYEPTLLLVTATLRFAAHIPIPLDHGLSISLNLYRSIPNHLPTTHQLWLSRVVLQTIWRWSHSQDPAITLNPFATQSICKTFTAGDGQALTILKTNCFLTMAISLGLQVGISDLYVPDNNDALETVIGLFNQRLQISIREGKAHQYDLATLMSTLTHLDPFQVKDTGESGFLWIAEILNSGYSEDERYEMASGVVRLLGKYLYSVVPERVQYVESAWIPSLIDFLSLCEKFYATQSPPSPPYPGFIILRILSDSPIRADLNPTVLPVLASMLLPTHPLQSRSLALEVFCMFTPEQFSSQTENFPEQDISKLLQAVDDPFKFTLEIPVEDGKPVFTAHCKPMKVAVLLIEFASLEVWRNHLLYSNFASCEDIVSTEEGKRDALKWMLDMATHHWFKFLYTPAKIVAAVKRLEELQCLNTAEVVIMWAWTTGVVDPMDRDAWRLIERETVRLCQTNRTGYLAALRRYITDTSVEDTRIMYLMGHYEGTPCRAGSTKKPDPALWVTPRLIPEQFTDLRMSQAYQLRRLYRLFGYDHDTWKEAIVAEKVEEEVDVPPGDHVASVPFVGWSCDYP